MKVNTKHPSVLGISKFKIFFKIILSQVNKKALITLMKDTALIYAVGLNEILKTYKIISNRDATLIPFILAGIIYFILVIIFTKALECIEKLYTYYK